MTQNPARLDLDTLTLDQLNRLLYEGGDEDAPVVTCATREEALAAIHAQIAETGLHPTAYDEKGDWYGMHFEFD